MKVDKNIDCANADDQKLAAAVKCGDRQAFEEIVRRHQGRVYAVAYRTWLLRLTANQAIDHTRRRRRHRHERLDEAFVPTSEQAPVEPTAADTGQLVGAKEIDARIREALHVLSATQRTVFMLRHYEGLQLAEIATEIGCTVGSVKVHLFRALKKLQKELGDLRD